ncbi:MAG TPA: hypothetical protein VG938_07905 [Verrucomicrobiae bacterium]|jgi:hypothetical protein|nr:hypothetical protein [Verrucomicrobiae bacterium]
MKTSFFIVCEGRLDSGVSLDSRFLLERGFFKTLSLLEAARAELNTPPTMLLLDGAYPPIGDIISRWGLPIMIRMDYGSFPKVKPLGGIPIYSLPAVKSISDSLFRGGLYPLLHPHIDRFTDIFSVGMIITRENSEVQMEIVGRGFDASDLRLGTAIPHESFVYDIHDDSISNRCQISPQEYKREKTERAKRIAQFECYIDYANREGRLLSSVGHFSPSPDRITNVVSLIPDSFTAIGRSEIKALAKFALKLQLEVLPKLPTSESFVASLSLVPRLGWILWDVYGHWYRR